MSKNEWITTFFCTLFIVVLAGAILYGILLVGKAAMNESGTPSYDTVFTVSGQIVERIPTREFSTWVTRHKKDRQIVSLMNYTYDGTTVIVSEPLKAEATP